MVSFALTTMYASHGFSPINDISNIITDTVHAVRRRICLNTVKPGPSMKYFKLLVVRVDHNPADTAA